MHRNRDTAARFAWWNDPSRHIDTDERGTTGLTLGLLASVAAALYVTGAGSFECMCFDPQTVVLRSWQLVESFANQLTVLI